jgi:hypothetical protein
VSDFKMLLTFLSFSSISGQRRFLKFFCVFLHFHYYLPLEKGNPLHLNKLETPPPKDDLCQFWLILPSGSGKEVENVEAYRWTDDQRSE